MQSMIKTFCLFSTIFVLMACGGGGSVSRDDSTDTGDTGSGTTATVEVSLSLQNSSGEADKNLTIDNPLTLVASVQNTSGEAQADRLLTFAISEPSLANFGNDTATARTNSQGIATITLTVGSASGDGEITASLSSGESGTTTFTSTGSGSASVQPASLQLYTGAVQLASSGSDEVELIALVKNEQSVLMEGVDVSFSANNNAGVELQITQAITAADGTARALVSTVNDASNRFVTVTAQTGALTEKVTIEVSGTEVTINGPSSVTINDTVEYTLRVQDSDGNAIPNQAITLTPGVGTLSADNSVPGADGTLEVTTAADGQIAVQYTATASGEDTFIAEALGDSLAKNIQVQQDEFEFTAFPAEEVALLDVAQITGRWRKDNAPVVGNTIRVTASRGTLVTADPIITNQNGEFTFSISSNNAGFSSITASGLNAEGEEEVVITEALEFIATTPYYLQADASQDILGPDGQTSTITAIVRDENDNLVKDTVVSFSVDDPSTGTISPSQATTNSNGVASTVYTSGAVSSHESVVITAQSVNAPAVQDQVLVTVANRAFDISIGTGNIITDADDSSYLKEFAVFVSDSAGQPVSGVELTASLSPVKYAENGGYYKGDWSWNGTIYTNSGNRAFCENEDQNDNGILDIAVDPDDYNEDTNNDNELTPGIIGALNFLSSSVSDENGQATLAYRYPKNYGGWVSMVIEIYGQSTGSEASAKMIYGLGVLSDDLTEEAVKPPASPFGVDTERTAADPYLHCRTQY
ncbi:invasin [Alteromonas sp. 345S023]|uniref:Invasin n=1 Tax=Alteromonas profundi TaxID=2696062 RepID=A0A7X5LIN0_9ALTE|nr:Ig-like domain-containing protein [Alteromonas profundi]NDV90024.1 invasin [Alteromonas profundi]